MDLDLNTYHDDGEFDIAFEGMEIDLSIGDRANWINEAATVIPHGYGVVRGATDKTCKLASGLGQSVLGIAVRHNTPAASVISAVTSVVGGGGFAIAAPGYGQYAAVPVMKRGRIGVRVASNVTRGSKVYLDVATGQPTGTASGNLVVPGAEFETTTAAGDIAIVYMNVAPGATA